MTDTITMLNAIPDLAVEVAATRDHPHRGAESEKTSKPKAGSKPPTNLAALHAEMGDDRGLRGTLAMCVRLVIDEWADTSTSDIPDYPTDTWEGICEWLAGTEATWVAMPWADDIDSDIRQVHGQLRMLARAPRQDLGLACRRCGDPLRLQDGGEWLLCDSGHSEEADLQKRYRRAPAMKEPDVAEEFGIRVGRIRVWRSRKAIKPAYTEAGVHWYYPWDILLLTYPWVADMLAEREGAA